MNIAMDVSKSFRTVLWSLNGNPKQRWVYVYDLISHYPSHEVNTYASVDIYILHIYNSLVCKYGVESVRNEIYRKTTVFTMYKN